MLISKGDFLLALEITLAEIIPTSHEGKQAFLVVIDHESLNSEPPSPLESRLEAVEKQLKILLKSVSNGSDVQEWARGDSNSGPPPCEGDVMTS